MSQPLYRQQSVQSVTSITSLPHELDDQKDPYDCDEDALRYNKRLKERRNRLMEELMRLENENQTHYDKLRDLLKPLNVSKKHDEHDDDDDDDDDDDEYDEHTLDKLDRFEEFKLQKITGNMSDEEKRDFLALLIRFLCVSNKYQRNEIKSLYEKQTSLYFQAQCLSLDEQREFHEAVSLKTRNHQKCAIILKHLAKFPNPHQIAEEYEKYLKLIQNININAKDEEEDKSWQKSVINDMETYNAYEQKANAAIPLSSPSISSKHSGSSKGSSASSEGRKSRRAPVKPIHKHKRSGLFRLVNRISHDKPQAQDSNDANRMHTESAASIASVASSAASYASHASSRYSSKQSVDLMGAQTNAPPVASTTRYTAISGPRLIRFDANYKQLSSRRQRCDVATVIAAFQNTHNLHSKMKRCVPTAGQNPFLREQNFGFDTRYSNGNIYVFDTIIEDRKRLQRHKDEAQQSNQPMTPAMLSLRGLSSNTNMNASMHFNTIIDIEEDYFAASPRPIMNVKKENNRSRRGWISLNQFIHLATNFGAHGQRDAQILVLTHKTFCESKQLLKGLRKRFWVPIPPNITPSEMATFRTTYVKQIRGKIIAVLRFWISKHYNADFRDDYALQKRMNKFITEINKNEEAQAMSIWLAQAFERQKKENAMTRKQKLHQNDEQVQSAQIAQKKKIAKFFYDTKTIDILHFKPEETAACITELNCASFLLIDQRECFEWIKQKEKAPHVDSMIARWNAMGNWAQRELLSAKRDFKKRLQCLKYFIQIVMILSQWGDFSGAYAINSALCATPVHRLKRYFAELTKKEHAILHDMTQLFAVSGNYPNLRAKMKNYLSKPCVPHIGLFTRDFTMLAEQKSTKLIDGIKYINFGKCKALAKAIGDLKMYQNNINKFDLVYPKPMLDYLETQLENKLLKEKELYDISIKVEPRTNN